MESTTRHLLLRTVQGRHTLARIVTTVAARGGDLVGASYEPLATDGREMLVVLKVVGGNHHLAHQLARLVDVLDVTEVETRVSGRPNRAVTFVRNGDDGHRPVVRSDKVRPPWRGETPPLDESTMEAS